MSYIPPPMPRTTCQDHNHPELSYAASFEWAAKKGKTHRQIKCQECGLYKIWVPKNRRTA